MVNTEKLTEVCLSSEDTDRWEDLSAFFDADGVLDLDGAREAGFGPNDLMGLRNLGLLEREGGTYRKRDVKVIRAKRVRSQDSEPEADTDEDDNYFDRKVAGAKKKSQAVQASNARRRAAAGQSSPIFKQGERFAARKKQDKEYADALFERVKTLSFEQKRLLLWAIECTSWTHGSEKHRVQTTRFFVKGIERNALVHLFEALDLPHNGKSFYLPDCIGAMKGKLKAQVGNQQIGAGELTQAKSKAAPAKVAAVESPLAKGAMTKPRRKPEDPWVTANKLLLRSSKLFNLLRELVTAATWDEELSANAFEVKTDKKLSGTLEEIEEVVSFMGFKRCGDKAIVPYRLETMRF